MISKRTKYGLKALLYLGKKYEKGPILVSEIATEESIPQKFLEAILLDLKNHGILQSKKGKGGGYLLGRSPDLITFGEVIRILDGPIALLPCISQTSYQKCEECHDEETCGLRILMKEVRDVTSGILDGTTLARLMDKVNNAKMEVNGAVMYTI
ncbi:MAG: Rrf2 family transcriptional regulator [Candidatus Omnitrophica bacterium]|nr:Rrf2 family transcriptional regulator [Candidatus Omnitrophota bacterium]